MSGDTPLYLVIAVIAIELAGIAMAVHAVMHARTAQGATAWAVALISFPFISLILYSLFGRNRFLGYVDARRRGDAEIQHIAWDAGKRYMPGNEVVFESDAPGYRAFEELAQMPFTRHNRLTLLIDGEATFEAIFRAIDAARAYILVQYYILRADDIGMALQQRLLARARDGVRIYLLFDDIGSYQLPRSYLQTLREAGAEVCGFGGRDRRRRRFQINFRNHRKLVLVDGREAFVGGLNVGDEYLGRDPKLSPWRDTHLRLEGPSVHAAQLAFIEDWHWATHGGVPELDWSPRNLPDADHRVLVLPTGPADERESCGLFFVHAINTARSLIWITSPYFVPDGAVLQALKLAALRGVQVRILLPETPDSILVDLASRAYTQEIIQAGIGLYRFEEGFLHQKVMLIDEDKAVVGTANLDNRSFRLNFEMSVLCADAGFARTVRDMLEADFARARRIDLHEATSRPFVHRAATRVARLFAPVL